MIEGALATVRARDAGVVRARGKRWVIIAIIKRPLGKNKHYLEAFGNYW